MRIQLRQWSRERFCWGNFRTDRFFTPTIPRGRPSCRMSPGRLVAGWLSRDPIGERGGRNLYGFVANTPINAIDMLGLESCFDTITGRLLSGPNINISVSPTKKTIPFGHEWGIFPPRLGISGDIFKICITVSGEIDCTSCCPAPYDGWTDPLSVTQCFEAGIGYGVKVRIPYIGWYKAGRAVYKTQKKGRQLLEDYGDEMLTAKDLILLGYADARVRQVVSDLTDLIKSEEFLDDYCKAAYSVGIVMDTISGE